MYTELHCHSAFSFLDGASLPEQLALTASQLGYSGVALTDHNGLYGSMAFAHEAKQLGLQAITGAEVTLLDGAHVTLLAETPVGYANLCRLTTAAHLGRADRRDPRLDFASLEARHEGLIVLSGCRSGLLPSVLQREGPTAARRFAERCRVVFGAGRFFVELPGVRPHAGSGLRVPGLPRGRPRACPAGARRAVPRPARRALSGGLRAPGRGRAAARGRADTNRTPSTQWILLGLS